MSSQLSIENLVELLNTGVSERIELNAHIRGFYGEIEFLNIKGQSTLSVIDPNEGPRRYRFDFNDIGQLDFEQRDKAYLLPTIKSVHIPVTLSSSSEISIRDITNIVLL